MRGQGGRGAGAHVAEAEAPRAARLHTAWDDLLTNRSGQSRAVGPASFELGHWAGDNRDERVPQSDAARALEKAGRLIRAVQR